MDTQDLLALVALVISVIALFGSILQLLQQYYSSAEGYSNCGKRVMGQWALSRNRKFRWTELRFEVQFEAPVMFVCPPSNTKGPVQGKSLLFVKGTKESEEETRTPSIETEKEVNKKMRESKQVNRDVHTADNERANWFIMLQAFHRMERESQKWQQGMLQEETNRLGPKRAEELPDSVALWESHSSVLALQPKRRSWDAMPPEIKRPYATSTIGHVVEMAAMLGLHWKEFDRSNHRYRAEGNGYMLTGREVNGLGIMFNFQIYGKNQFNKNRLIPRDETKMFCFGNVPTIFRDISVPYDNEDPKSTGVIQLGSATELVETLSFYGCNPKTTNYFRDDRKYRLGHLYPIAFEVLGMVAESLYIPKTYYRFLPNPTTFAWNRKSFRLKKLLLEYGECLTNDDVITMRTSHIVDLTRWCDELRLNLVNWKNEDVFSITLLQALHESIKKCDAYLISNETLVKLVIREHIQEVMRLLNEGTSHSSLSHDERDDSTLSSADHARRAFDDLNSAGPEERQKMLMDIYFTTVLQAVTRKCHVALLKQKSTALVHTPHNRSAVDLSAASAAAAAASQVPPTPPADSVLNNGLHEAPKFLITKASSDENAAKLKRMPTLEHEVLTEEVWCTLMFRMFCWLLLYDFHKKDVQISKSELYDSRLPVYIA